MSDRWTFIFMPTWVQEGFVIEEGSYPRRFLSDGGTEGVEQVLTTLGWATPVEPSEQEPTVGPGVFTTGTTA